MPVSTSRCTYVFARDVVEERGGGGVWNPKVCVPKKAQIDISFCKFPFFPTMKSGSWGGLAQGLGGWVLGAGGYPPVKHSVWLLFLYEALDSHPVFPSQSVSGRCVLSAAAAGAPAGVVSAFAEPSRWCPGAVLVAAGCAVCASAAPSSWRSGGCAGCCGGHLTVFAVHTSVLRPSTTCLAASPLGTPPCSRGCEPFYDISAVRVFGRESSRRG